MPLVKCEVTKCKYNQQGICTADSIQIVYGYDELDCETYDYSGSVQTYDNENRPIRER